MFESFRLITKKLIIVRTKMVIKFKITKNFK